MRKGCRSIAATAVHGPPTPWFSDHFGAATRQTILWKDVCTQVQNTNGSASEKRFVRVTHPFHPLCGGRYLLSGFRYNRYGRRVLLKIEEGIYRTIPPQWTDLSLPDPEVVISAGRSFFRVTDLIDLARMIDCRREIYTGRKTSDV